MLLIIAALFSSSCSADNAQTEKLGFTDALGHTINVNNPKKTAVCSGSLAEIWQLAGGSVDLVTQDAYDEHLFTLPDDTINIGTMKSPSVEAMLSENVDFVIMSSLIAEHVSLYDTLTSAGITVAYFEVENLDDYLAALKICTEITGKPELYEKNGETVKARVEAAISSASGKGSPAVLLLRAYSSGVKAKGSDTMTGKMLADLGCKNIADSDLTLLEDLSLEAIIKADPDFIFVTTMGADEEKALESVDAMLTNNPAWAELTAIKSGRYVVLTKALYHYKPNARWGEAYEKLSEILYG